MNALENIGNIVLGPQQHAADLASQAATFQAEVKELKLNRPHYYTFEVLGRTYLVRQSTGSAEQILPHKEKLFALPDVGSVNGFAATVKRFFDPCKTVITVGPGGIVAETVIHSETQVPAESPTLKAPYFRDDHAPSRELTIEQLYTWLDRYSGRLGQTKIDMGEEKAIWAALRSIRAVKADTYEVEDQGGSVSVRAKTEAGVSGEAPIPKFIMVEHRTGVTEFKTICLYRLRAIVPKGDKASLAFTLTQMVEADGSVQKFVSWAVQQLDTLLNPSGDGQWIVTEGVGEE